MSDKKQHVFEGRRGGKTELIMHWIGQQRGTTWLLRADGTKEVFEDAEVEVIDPNRLPEPKPQAP